MVDREGGGLKEEERYTEERSISRTDLFLSSKSWFFYCNSLINSHLLSMIDAVDNRRGQLKNLWQNSCEVKGLTLSSSCNSWRWKGNCSRLKVISASTSSSSDCEATPRCSACFSMTWHTMSHVIFLQKVGISTKLLNFNEYLNTF